MKLSLAPHSELEADLRRRICALELPPGTPLSRPELLREYGVSSTPLRDALMQLQADRLVVVQPQSGTMVSLIDLDHARQIHLMRSAAEQEAAAIAAARPNPALADEIGQIVVLSAEMLARQQMDGFARLDLAFHDALFRAAALPEIRRIIRRESGHIDRLRALHLMQPQKAREIIADHSAIATAIREGRPDAARAAMGKHLSQSIQIGAQLRGLHPHYFT
ncbi:MAG: GntR family transcriptional regulator [Paracoccus sp. (in: a-proteobacteria)]|nr:GntR family transcriptional regulator [Paracoccus sp. (in: a-proteobacteria)]